jgi:hypothetical protein
MGIFTGKCPLYRRFVFDDISVRTFMFFRRTMEKCNYDHRERAAVRQLFS